MSTDSTETEIETKESVTETPPVESPEAAQESDAAAASKEASVKESDTGSTPGTSGYMARPPRKPLSELNVGDVLDGVVYTFVEDAQQVLKRGMKVKLKLLEADQKLKASMKDLNTFDIESSKEKSEKQEKRNIKQYPMTEEFEGVVEKVLARGAFVKFDNGFASGFLPVEEISTGKNLDAKDIRADELLVPQEVLTVRVIETEKNSGKHTLSMRTYEELESERKGKNEGFFIDADDSDDAGDAAILSAAFKRAGIVRGMFADVESEMKATPVKEAGTVMETITSTSVGNMPVPEPDIRSPSEATESETVKQETKVTDQIQEIDAVLSETIEEKKEEEAADTIVETEVALDDAPDAEDAEGEEEAEEIAVKPAAEVQSFGVDISDDETVLEEHSPAETVADVKQALAAQEESKEPSVTELGDVSMIEPKNEVVEEAKDEMKEMNIQDKEEKSDTVAIDPVPEVESFNEKISDSSEVMEENLEPTQPVKAEEKEIEEKPEEPSIPFVEAAAGAESPVDVVVPSEKPSVDTSDSVQEAAPKTSVVVVSASLVKELREISGTGMMDCKKALTECNCDMDAAIEYLKKKGIASVSKRAGKVASEGVITSYIHTGNRLGVLLEVNSETDFVARTEAFKTFVEDVAMTIAANPDTICIRPEDFPEDVLNKEKEMEMSKEDLQNKPDAIKEKIVSGRLEKIKKTAAVLEQPFIQDQEITVQEALNSVMSSLGEKIVIRRFVRYELGEGLEKKSKDFATEVAEQIESKKAEAASKPEPVVEEKPVEEKPTVTVSAAMIKELRQMTGGGFLNCKMALIETQGDLDKAAEYLRMKGLAGAAKKASRLASEGVICSYIHLGSRLGIMAEVNCETDFVSRGEVFRQLADDIAMQLAACPEVVYISSEDIPQEVLDKEMQSEMEVEDLQSKPENIREKIAEGRVRKTLSSMCLFDQPFLPDPEKLVGDVVKEHIATLGENIKVRRFVRFNLGEGIDRPESDFAKEVAEQIQKQ